MKDDIFPYKNFVKKKTLIFFFYVTACNIVAYVFLFVICGAIYLFFKWLKQNSISDATVSSRAIVMDVDTPDQINAVFDTISYSKGSSVIRMMENFMGTEDFKAGIKKFLEDFSYKNAVTQDLFDALEAACDLEITEVISAFSFH